MRLVPALLLLASCNVERAIGSTVEPGDLARPPIPEPTPTRKLDLLLVIDDSASMAPLVEKLSWTWTALHRTLAERGAKIGGLDLHVGVITSDHGAGATGAPGCRPSSGEHGGKLQPLGAFAPPTCRGPVGANYLDLVLGGDGANNLPPGQSFEETLTCMTWVVTSNNAGCGYEHHLEAAHAALSRDLPENAGFLREDAILAIFFFGNEDDCSAPPDSDLFDKARVAEYGYLSSYRCTRFGVICDGVRPPYGASKGPLTGCRPMNGWLLHDAGRYVGRFTRPRGEGGVKWNPGDVVLGAIIPPPSPFTVILSNPGTPATLPYTPCGALGETWNPPCVPVLQHVCQVNGSIGDPAVRLAHVVDAAPVHYRGSLCDGDYGQHMALFAARVAERVRP